MTEAEPTKPFHNLHLFGNTTMTINDLIARFEEYRDAIGGDADVRLMTQSNWPFEYSICGLASGAEINEEHRDADGEFDDEDEDVKDVADSRVLYICEGRQLAYGTKVAWDAAH